MGAGGREYTEVAAGPSGYGAAWAEGKDREAQAPQVLALLPTHLGPQL